MKEVKDEETLELLMQHCFGCPHTNASEIAKELEERGVDYNRIFDCLYDVLALTVTGGKYGLGD